LYWRQAYINFLKRLIVHLRKMNSRCIKTDQ
jgi:hypothetical protein